MATGTINFPIVTYENINIGNYQNGSSSPFLIKYGKLRVLQLYALKNLTANSDVTIGFLPSDSKPSDTTTVGMIDNAGHLVNVRLLTNGGINVYAYNYTDANIRGELVYFV